MLSSLYRRGAIYSGWLLILFFLWNSWKHFAEWNRCPFELPRILLFNSESWIENIFPQLLHDIFVRLRSCVIWDNLPAISYRWFWFSSPGQTVSSELVPRVLPPSWVLGFLHARSWRLVYRTIQSTFPCHLNLNTLGGWYPCNSGRLGSILGTRIVVRPVFAWNNFNNCLRCRVIPPPSWNIST